ncbi:hypothetical protein L873DRAFT_422107 [Choiromyces venosus 120613-1]|uniref:Uncharacterized protein n=1 Tax=Choiromyces venosus 120613-1 TaxID=1336337 RepID=A0A3N4K0B1_9PEZI|nr:hypothetical protein L873DRAFT_422107 [Choiromyces venosus 120613-1]
MAQNPPPPGRLYYGGVPAGYMITTNVNLPYPLPPQLPVLLQPTPSNLYPVSVQMATQPATSKPILGAHTVYSAPAPPARPANTPAGYNFVFHPQPQPAQAVTPRAAPGTATQYVPGAYPDAEAVALAQAQAASLAAHAAEVAKNHAAGVAIAKAEAANVQYYFGNSTCVRLGLPRSMPMGSSLLSRSCVQSPLRIMEVAILSAEGSTILDARNSMQSVCLKKGSVCHFSCFHFIELPIAIF